MGGARAGLWVELERVVGGARAVVGGARASLWAELEQFVGGAT